MLRPHSIDVSRCMVFHGQTWLADRPELDINSITFRCWTAQGQLVEAFPNGRVYYIHDGLLRIFPINLLYSTSLPVYWIGTIPVLACEQDLQPLFDCPDMPVDIYSSFPNVPILHVTGPALDIQLIQLTPEGTLPVQIPRQIPRGPEMKAVNAFIAYRGKLTKLYSYIHWTNRPLKSDVLSFHSPLQANGNLGYYSPNVAA